MNLGDKCQKSDSLKRKNSENLASCGQESAPIPSAPLPQLPEGLRRSLSLSLFLSNDSARRAHTVMCFRTQSFVHGGASQNKDCCVASRGAKSVSIFFSRPAFPSLRKNVWKQIFLQPRVPFGPLEDRDPCDRIGGVQATLGAAWAS